MIFIATVSFISCKKKEPPNVANMDGGTYFSIVQFARDQFTTFWGQPYTLQKVVTLNGKTDSSFVPVMQMDWASVLKPFLIRISVMKNTWSNIALVCLMIMLQ